MINRNDIISAVNRIATAKSIVEEQKEVLMSLCEDRYLQALNGLEILDELLAEITYKENETLITENH